MIAGLPLFIVAGTILVGLMIASGPRRSPDAAVGVALTGFLLALAVAFGNFVPGMFTLFVFDSLSRFGILLSLVAAVAAALFARIGLEREPGDQDEFQMLLGIGALGSLVLASSNHFVTLFLGIELIALSSTALVAWRRVGSSAGDAALTSLILSAVAAAILLFGIAFVYTDTASLGFPTSPLTGLTAIGIVLIIVALAFKLSLAPFHQLTPEVYAGGSPAAMVFLSSVAKVGPAIVTYRLLEPLIDIEPKLVTILVVLAAVSMCVGGLFAIRQRSIRRLLAGSSTVHFGNLLLAVVLQSEATLRLYLVGYVLGSVLVGGALAISGVASDDRDDRDQLSGLWNRSPVFAGAMLIGWASLLGWPLTIGFVGKLEVLRGSLMAFPLWVPIIVIISSVLTAVAYGSAMIAVIGQGERKEHLPIGGTAAVVILAVAVIVLGIAPSIVL